MKTPLAILLLLVGSIVAQDKVVRKGPLVLIEGNGNVSIATGAVGGGIAAVGSGSVSKHDQTMEMAQQLLKRCPEITLTVGTDQKPDYMLFLNREGGGFFNAGDSQIMLVRGSDKLVLYASKQGTVTRAMKDGCKAIMRDWKRQILSPARASSAQDPGWWNTEKKPAASSPH